jgi:hypothetical protein
MEPTVDHSALKAIKRTRIEEMEENPYQIIQILCQRIESLEEVVKLLVNQLTPPLNQTSVPRIEKPYLTAVQATSQDKSVNLSNMNLSSKKDAQSMQKSEPIIEEWKQVKSKRQSKSKDVIAKQSLKETLGQATSREEKLKLILRTPKAPEERVSEVSSIRASLPLSRRAHSQPMLAWKQALEGLTGHTPLMVSLLNPCQGEVFYDSKTAPEVSQILKQKGYLVETPQALSEKDIVRRKQAYLAAHFLPLRRAALEGFCPDLQRKMLEQAATSVTSKFSDRWTQHRWKHQITKDLAGINGHTDM